MSNCGCGSKFEAIIVASSFEGMGLLARQQTVNGIISAEMQVIHAFSMRCWTPAQHKAKVPLATLPLEAPASSISPSATAGGSGNVVVERVRKLSGSPVQVLVDENDSLVYLVPSLLSDTDAAAVFTGLAGWDGFQRASDDFGPQDRLTGYFGDPGAIFSYVGLVCRPLEWLPCVMVPRERANLIASCHGPVTCTGCLVNNYEAGEGSSMLCWHKRPSTRALHRPVITQLGSGPANVVSFASSLLQSHFTATRCERMVH